MLSRTAGILVHPTSFHTKYGIGDIGPVAKKFIDKLEHAKQSFWQVLPLGPTGYGDSPYQTLSSFAGNPLLISPEGLIKLGLINNKDISEVYADKGSFNQKWQENWKINYEEAADCKYSLFERAFNNYRTSKSEFQQLEQEFNQYCKAQSYWLDDYAHFYVLKRENNMESWTKWSKNYFQRMENAIKVHQAMRKKEIQYYKFIQFLFDYQWNELKSYTNSKGISIIGDMPIFVAHDSAEVWINREFFTLNKDGTLEYQAGVPPDYFSKTGQLWGNPLFKWKMLEKDNFSWIIQRLKRVLEMVDWVRVDHFRGFEAYWRVKGDAENAMNGEWINAPGEKLFATIKEQLGELPIIAEDLGVITKEVEDLRDQFNFPGMKVLQFAFSNESDNVHLPHNYVQNSIVYSGTHDNNTFKGWITEDATQEQKTQIQQYFQGGLEEMEDILIPELYKTVANLCILPIQDILQQGSWARVNTPSKPEGNWQYTFELEHFNEQIIKSLAQYSKLFGRINSSTSTENEK